MRVFHPGFVSVEGGPHFNDAVLQIGDEPPRSGDVICVPLAGAPGHDQNKNFQNVILHVVWESDQTPNASSETNSNRPPTLALRHFLDAPLAELSFALENEPLRSLTENLRGKCSAPLHGLSESQLTELLRAAAQVRFENKAATMLTRAKNSGWEQALWENWFRALGYKHNIWPMQNLAETKSRWLRDANSAFEISHGYLGSAAAR